MHSSVRTREPLHDELGMHSVITIMLLAFAEQTCGNPMLVANRNSEEQESMPSRTGERQDSIETLANTLSDWIQDSSGKMVNNLVANLFDRVLVKRLLSIGILGEG